jgi:hypothetical protein
LLGLFSLHAFLLHCMDLAALLWQPQVFLSTSHQERKLHVLIFLPRSEAQRTWLVTKLLEQARMLRVFGMYDCTPGSLIVNGEPLIAPCPFCFDVDLSIYRVLPGTAKASSDLHGFSIQLEIMHIIREPETISFCSFNGTSSFPFLGAPFDSDVSTSPAGAERNGRNAAFWCVPYPDRSVQQHPRLLCQTSVRLLLQAARNKWLSQIALLLPFRLVL